MQQVVLLEDEADPVAAELGAPAIAQLGGVDALDPDPARGRAHQQAAEVEHRRLPAARASDDGHELAGVDTERHAVEGADGRPALLVVLDQVGHLDESHLRLSPYLVLVSFFWFRSG